MSKRRHEECYATEQVAVVRAVLGDSLVMRFQKAQEIYQQNDMAVQFVTYPGIGHETNNETETDVVAFFKHVIENQ